MRSRKSDRNVRVADLRRSWTFRSSSKTSVSAQSWSWASGSRKPRLEMADADEDRRRVRVLGALHRHRKDLVVGEELDRRARRGRASARRRPSCRRARGRGGSPRPSPARGRRTRPPADSAMWTVARVVVGERERLERRRPLEPRRQRVPVDEQGRWRRHALALLAPPRRSSRCTCSHSLRPCASTSSGSDTNTIGRSRGEVVERRSRYDPDRPSSPGSSCSGAIAAWSSATLDRCVAGS